MFTHRFNIVYNVCNIGTHFNYYYYYAVMYAFSCVRVDITYMAIYIYMYITHTFYKNEDFFFKFNFQPL